jgi:hypothetical protein
VFLVSSALVRPRRLRDGESPLSHLSQALTLAADLNTPLEQVL